MHQIKPVHIHIIYIIELNHHMIAFTMREIELHQVMDQNINISI